VATVFGILFLLPAPSWQQLVGVITGATAIMYGFAPLALGTLRKKDPHREHPYLVPWPVVMLPLGFIFATLIIYWGGFNATWQLSIGLLIGQLVYIITGRRKAREEGSTPRWSAAIWIWVWLGGMVLLGWLGNFGGGIGKLPQDWDALIIAVFALIIYFWVTNTGQATANIERAVSQDLAQQSDDTALITLPDIAGTVTEQPKSRRRTD
jgi:amino acid transporter